jgi:phosphatidylserine/phosphatidylglycerophosphate/cardiolipin synthase-like enzyme
LNEIFQNDWGHKKNIVYNENLVLSPHYSRAKFEKLLKNAKKEIYMYFPYLKDEKLKNILLEKRKNGIKIKIIIDKKASEKN